MRDSEEAAAQVMRRIEGQIKEIQQMLEETGPCEEVLTQIMVVRAALDRVALSVMADGMEKCLAETQPSKVMRATIDRALTLLLRMSPATPAGMSE